jgi:glycosyltransferase involved in cell wall biosynthesis
VHVLFIHKNFPVPFGHVAAALVRDRGFQCTCAWQGPQGAEQIVDGIRLIPYQINPQATTQTHFCSQDFERSVWHCHGVYLALKAHPEVRPDLVVGPSGYGATLFLAELYRCPIVNYCDYYYRPGDSYLDYRPEFPRSEIDRLRARTRNAMSLLDLQTCIAAYSPTAWQRSLYPAEYQHKIATIFDGIDRGFWQRRGVPRRIGAGPLLSSQTRIVTYVARGFEAARGFDIFMKVAKRIYQARSDVLFVVVGSDAFYYGEDLKYIRSPSFREHVLSQDRYDMSRFVFTGPIQPPELLDILSLSDLHIYLTVPYVLSWSLLNALACGCTVLASDTAPVQEVIRHEQNGLLADFYDVDGLVQQALRVLEDPRRFHPLGQAGVQLIDAKYSLARTIPEVVGFYQRVVRGSFPAPSH